MAASLSLYRKYRSPDFDELVGQEPVVRTLKNAIASNRIAHAYLFTGPRGVGKTSAARLLARAANCLLEGVDKPCNKCANCTAANRDIATDLIEIDAASNTGVDNIREVIERAQFAPSVWHTKFYIIDEVHMLSVSAFNALLKTLEEPPPHTSFILATTEVHKVPATVASRCQRFDFRRIPLQDMVARMQWICEQEGIEAEKPALELVARNATGSLRDALSLLDQLRVYSESGVTLKNVQDMLGASASEEVAVFIDSLVAGDLAAGLRQINRVVDDGLDLRQFNRQIVEHLRSLMLAKSGAASSGGIALDVTEEMKERLNEQAKSVTIPDLLRWIQAFAEVDGMLRSTAHRQLPLEMALVAATLKPGEMAARAPVRGHAAGLPEGIEQIGVVPAKPRTPLPAQRDAARPGSMSEMPPPIHTELDAGLGVRQIAGGVANGSGQQPGAANGKSPEESISMVAARGEDPHLDIHADLDKPNIPREAGSPDDELARLRELWSDLVDQIKARSRPMAVAFSNFEKVRPIQIKAGVCTIGFLDSFHAAKSQELLQRQLIETSLSRVLGYPCRLESVTFAELESSKKGDNGAEGKQPKGPGVKERPSPYETTRGKAAMNIFGISKFDDKGEES
jgi:DNA polymerase-3 subunit gamma/tau